MKNVLYIGNKLNNNTSNLSGIQTLGTLLECEGFFVYYASSISNKLLRLLDMVLTCFKLSRKIDIVLIDTYSTQNFYYAYIVSQFCKLLNLDYVPILRGGNLPSRLINSPKFSQKIFTNAKCNISPSMYLKVAFENAGYDNIVHIPNTIKIDDYHFETRTFDSPKLLWVRSFSKIYNPELAIHVLRKLSESYPDSSLCMVGPDADGSQKDVESLAKKFNLNVKFTGKLEKKEWIDLSKNYNVFINTTNFDNTPVSVIEAMALGLPIVSTNVGGLPYLIKDNVDGLLVEPNHYEKMSAAVISIIRDSKKRDELINNARNKVENFDWNQVKHLWLSVLDSN